MDQKTEQHKPTAEAIAVLPGGILETREYGAFDIALPNDGGKLHLTFDTYRAKNRVVVSGYWPSWMPPGKQWNEVVTPAESGGWRVDCIREAEDKVDLTLRGVPVETALEIVKLLRSGQ